MDIYLNTSRSFKCDFHSCLLEFLRKLIFYETCFVFLYLIKEIQKRSVI